MTIKAQKLKELLEGALGRLNELDEDAEIVMQPNTYFLDECRLFLGISGCDGGYVALDKIEVDREDVVKEIEVDMCVKMSDEDYDGDITWPELEKLAKARHVLPTYSGRANGWPVVKLKGKQSDLYALLVEDLEYDSDEVEEWVYDD